MPLSTEISQFRHLSLVTVHAIGRTELTFNLKLPGWKWFFKLHAEESSLAMVNAPFMSGERVGQLHLKNQPFLWSSCWSHTDSPSWLPILPGMGVCCPRWRSEGAWGSVCMHAHVCVTVQSILFSPSQSHFYQACLPCCPQETVETLHQIFKVFSKYILLPFSFCSRYLPALKTWI